MIALFYEDYAKGAARALAGLCSSKGSLARIALIACAFWFAVLRSTSSLEPSAVENTAGTGVGEIFSFVYRDGESVIDDGQATPIHLFVTGASESFAPPWRPETDPRIRSLPVALGHLLSLRTGEAIRVSSQYVAGRNYNARLKIGDAANRLANKPDVLVVVVELTHLLRPQRGKPATGVVSRSFESSPMQVVDQWLGNAFAAYEHRFRNSLAKLLPASLSGFTVEFDLTGNGSEPNEQSPTPEFSESELEKQAIRIANKLNTARIYPAAQTYAASLYESYATGDVSALFVFAPYRGGVFTSAERKGIRSFLDKQETYVRSTYDPHTISVLNLFECGCVPVEAYRDMIHHDEHVAVADAILGRLNQNGWL